MAIDERTIPAAMRKPLSRHRPSDRLVSLDVFRGLTVAGMILVTDPGTYSAVYPPLLHAPWDGATPTDMIFPSFLFIVGVSITLSFASRIERGYDRTRLAWHVLRRGALIFLLGLALNGFPDYNWQTLRLPGILQRIAICYLCGGLLYLMASSPGTRDTGTRDKGAPISHPAAVVASAVVAILAGYWVVLKYVSVPGIGAGHLDTFGNLPACVDRAVLGTIHMWAYGLTPGRGVTYDPEGILSTLPATATLLIGVLAGEWMRTLRSGAQKAIMLALAGVVLVVAGCLLSPFLVINKRIWTSTFTLFSGGVSLLLFGLIYAVVDLGRRQGYPLWVPARIFGTNAILAFAISTVITTLSDRLHLPAVGGASLTLHHWGYQHLFATWLIPIHASLAYAIAIVLLNLAILYPLYRRRIFLKM